MGHDTHMCHGRGPRFPWSVQGKSSKKGQLEKNDFPGKNLDDRFLREKPRFINRGKIASGWEFKLWRQFPSPSQQLVCLQDCISPGQPAHPSVCAFHLERGVMVVVSSPVGGYEM